MFLISSVIIVVQFSAVLTYQHPESIESIIYACNTRFYKFYVSQKNAYATQSTIKVFASVLRFDHLVVKLFDQLSLEGEEPFDASPERVWPWPENAPEDAGEENLEMDDLSSL